MSVEWQTNYFCLSFVLVRLKYREQIAEYFERRFDGWPPMAGNAPQSRRRRRGLIEWRAFFPSSRLSITSCRNAWVYQEQNICSLLLGIHHRETSLFCSGPDFIGCFSRKFTTASIVLTKKTFVKSHRNDKCSRQQQRCVKDVRWEGNYRAKKYHEMNRLHHAVSRSRNSLSITCLLSC